MPFFCSEKPNTQHLFFMKIAYINKSGFPVIVKDHNWRLNNLSVKAA